MSHQPSNLPDVTPAPASSARVGRVVVGVSLWALLVLAGLSSIWRYETRPSPAAKAVGNWPTTRLQPARGKLTLVMTVHPLCPCSRASVSELATLTALYPDQITGYVLFAEAVGLTEESAVSELWESASQIKGVTCIRDRSGHLSNDFGAQTSGQVFVYDASATLRFSGGITPSRGHVGESAGRSAIESLVRGDAPARSTAPVFGCSLQ